MTISDSDFRSIENNLPSTSFSSVIDEKQKWRFTRAFLAIDLLKRLPLHHAWAISYPTIELLGAAQDGPIVHEAGPTDTIELIYKLLQEAMFTSTGLADWRVLNLLKTNGFLTIRAFSKYEDDSYHVRTIRGHFVLYPPETTHGPH